MWVFFKIMSDLDYSSKGVAEGSFHLYLDISCDWILVKLQYNLFQEK